MTFLYFFFPLFQVHEVLHFLPEDVTNKFTPILSVSDHAFPSALFSFRQEEKETYETSLSKKAGFIDELQRRPTESKTRKSTLTLKKSRASYMSLGQGLSLSFIILHVCVALLISFFLFPSLVFLVPSSSSSLFFYFLSLSPSLPPPPHLLSLSIILLLLSLPPPNKINRSNKITQKGDKPSNNYTACHFSLLQKYPLDWCDIHTNRKKEVQQRRESFLAVKTMTKRSIILQQEWDEWS